MTIQAKQKALTSHVNTATKAKLKPHSMENSSAVKNKATSKDGFETKVGGKSPLSQLPDGPGKQALQRVVATRGADGPHYEKLMASINANKGDAGSDVRCQVAAWALEGTVSMDQALKFMATPHNESWKKATEALSVVDTLPPVSEGTRQLKSTLLDDFMRVDAGLADGSMTPADFDARASQWSDIGESLIGGRQPKGHESQGDYGPMSRDEGQYLQSVMATNLLKQGDKINWGEGIWLLQHVRDAVPAPGEKQTLEQRSDMLLEIRGAEEQLLVGMGQAPRAWDFSAPFREAHPERTFGAPPEPVQQQDAQAVSAQTTPPPIRLKPGVDVAEILKRALEPEVAPVAPQTPVPSGIYSNKDLNDYATRTSGKDVTVSPFGIFAAPKGEIGTNKDLVSRRAAEEFLSKQAGASVIITSNGSALVSGANAAEYQGSIDRLINKEGWPEDQAKAFFASYKLSPSDRAKLNFLTLDGRVVVTKKLD